MLIAQLHDYHIYQPPYNASYTYNFDIPIKWWQTCEINPLYFQLLAIKLFSVLPHSASCERVWSVYG